MRVRDHIKIGSEVKPNVGGLVPLVFTDDGMRLLPAEDYDINGDEIFLLIDPDSNLVVVYGHHQETWRPRTVIDELREACESSGS